MNEWAYRPIQEPKGGNMGDWIYKSYGFKSLMETMKEPPEHFGRMKPVHVGLEEENKDRIIVAKSPETALQKDWKTPTDFPLCPTLISKTPLQFLWVNWEVTLELWHQNLNHQSPLLTEEM